MYPQVVSQGSDTASSAPAASAPASQPAPPSSRPATAPAQGEIDLKQGNLPAAQAEKPAAPGRVAVIDNFTSEQFALGVDPAASQPKGGDHYDLKHGDLVAGMMKHAEVNRI